MRKIINFFKSKGIDSDKILQSSDDIYQTMKRHLPFVFRLTSANFEILSAPFDTTGFTFTKIGTGHYEFEAPAANLPMTFTEVVPVVHSSQYLTITSAPIILCSLYCPGGGPGSYQTITIKFVDTAGLPVDPTPASSNRFYVNFPFIYHGAGTMLYFNY